MIPRLFSYHSAGTADERPHHIASIFPALATLSLLLLTTVWLWFNARQQVLEVAENQFNHKVSESLFAINQRLLAYEQILLGGLGLFTASESVTREEWRRYVNTLNIEEHYPGIRGVGFTKVLKPQQLDEHIQDIRQQGFPNYRVYPEGARYLYTAIVYLEPFDWRNQRAFGYDMFSEPTRRAAMERARDTGYPSVSGRVTLVQETSEAVQQGFLMYLPWYKNGEFPDSVDERRRSLLGYVYAPFRMNDLMNGTLGQEVRPIVRLQIFDNGRPKGANLMFDSMASRISPPENGLEQPPSFAIYQFLEFSGRWWLLRFSTLPAFDAMIDHARPWIILISGCIASFLISLVLWFLSQNRQKATRLSKINRELASEIEQRVRLETRLRLAKEKAEQANQAKSQFLANVSHELRTPLTLILAPLEQLGTSTQPADDWKDKIHRLQRNALRLLNRVNDVLDFSKSESGKLKVHPEAVNLVKVIETLCRDAEELAAQKQCELSYKVDEDLAQVVLDGQLFEKIALNYLSNALKFTPPGGHIHLEAKVIKDKRFEFSVTDNGPGIPQEQQHKLFQRFQQLDNLSTRYHGGTGIGLALVKQIARLMKGEAGLVSSPGQGASFYVRLPRTMAVKEEKLHSIPSVEEDSTLRHLKHKKKEIKRAELVSLNPLLKYARIQECSETSKEKTIESQQTKNEKQGKRILVVDDNADMRAYLCELLLPEYDIYTVENGLQAWEALQHSAFDLLVSDVMMPEMDGFELTKKIKNSPDFISLPVILVTARGGVEASVVGLDAGADDYLAKPFAPEELLARVKSALRIAELQQEIRNSANQAGMANMAGSIIHNLGNVLNGILTSANLVTARLKQMRLSRLDDISSMLERVNLPHESQNLPEYVAQLSKHLQVERNETLSEMKVLDDCVLHAAQVIASYRRIIKPDSHAITEQINADQLMNQSLELAQAAFSMKNIAIERQYDYTGVIQVERHLVLQILVNLLLNASEAIRRFTSNDPLIRLTTRLVDDHVHFVVEDNGEGLEAEVLDQLFHQIFSNKEQGRGYGLHGSAGWAEQMGGELRANSFGFGKGSIFILELPLRPGNLKKDKPYIQKASGGWHG